MSQSSQIKSYLETGKTLTPIEALEKFKCLRLASRVWDINKEISSQGLKIVDIGRKNYAVYKLSEETK